MALTGSSTANVPAAEMPQAEFQAHVTRALTAHETAVNLAKQEVELDFLLGDEKLKQEMVDALAADSGSTPKRVVAFKVVTARLVADEVPGARRLAAESEQNLTDGILRFKSRHFEPREGKPWVFSLAPGLGVTQNFREALADLAACGGNERLKVRRPLLHWGPAVSTLAQSVLGKDKSKKGGKEGSKGKGKGGKDKGKKGRGKGKGKEKTAATNNAVPPAAAFVPPAAPPPTQTVPSGGSTPTLPAETAEPTVAASEPSSGSTAPPATYASLAADDEANFLDAEMGVAGGKRDGDKALSAHVPFKKSSPSVERKAPAKAAHR